MGSERLNLAFRSGDEVRVRATGETGEVFKTDALDPNLCYKVLLDSGFPEWFGPDALEAK